MSDKPFEWIKWLCCVVLFVDYVIIISIFYIFHNNHLGTNIQIKSQKWNDKNIKLDKIETILYIDVGDAYV